jgi:hypothetical protein
MLCFLLKVYAKRKDSGIHVGKIGGEGRKRRAKIKFKPACGEVQILILNFIDCLLLYTQYMESVVIDCYCFTPTNSVAPEPEVSSPHSQRPANAPYLEPGESTRRPPKPISLRSILIPSSHLRLGLPSGLFPSGFPAKTLYTFLPSPMRATCPIHLILLDLVCLIMYCFAPLFSKNKMCFWSVMHSVSQRLPNEHWVRS